MTNVTYETTVSEPNLEESYLAFVAARGRTSVAQQDGKPVETTRAT